MSRRRPTAERRQQIVLAALKLLASEPVERVTTRAIAAEVGISQPALFRHFASRAAILEAVAAYSRDALRSGAEAALTGDPDTGAGADWASAAAAIAEVVSRHARQHPGLPRLYFHTLASRGGTSKPPLDGLVDMQAGLISALVRQGQRAGELPPSVDDAAAGRVFVALIQGAIAGWLARPEQETLQTAVRMWIAAVRAGEPARAPPAEAAPERSEPREALTALDVRPLIARGEEPLDVILRALEQTRSDGLLLLTTPFRPAPLLTLLKARGYTVDAEEPSRGRWELMIRGPRCPAPLDVRELEAPEPMAAVLAATGHLTAPDVVVALTPQLPRLLLPRLTERGLTWDALERADGSALLHIRGRQ